MNKSFIAQYYGYCETCSCSDGCGCSCHEAGCRDDCGSCEDIGVITPGQRIAADNSGHGYNHYPGCPEQERMD